VSSELQVRTDTEVPPIETLGPPRGGAPESDVQTAPPAVQTQPRGRRHSGALADRKHAIRYWVTMGILAVLAVGFTVGLLAYDNPMEFGTDAFWRIASLRLDTLLTIVVVAFCHALATVAFQTATNNRIITPSIMGFESLYVATQTGAVFLFGAVGTTMLIGLPQFFIQAGAMVLFAMVLYTWLLSGRFSNIHIMLLVGVVIGGGLGSLSNFMQRMLTPSEFDVLSGRLFGSISNARTEYLPYAIPIALLAGAALWWKSRQLNVVALGKNTANNLGLNHKREVMKILFLVSILMAMTTSLIGPITFLGFLVATLSYQLADTYSHRLLFPMAILLGYVLLTGAYFILRNIFYAQGVVTIIIELIGGCVFLFFVLRKGRL